MKLHLIKFILLAVGITSSSIINAQNSGTFVGSNSVFNQFQCNNGPWLFPNPNLIVFNEPCTPLKGKSQEIR